MALKRKRCALEHSANDSAAAGWWKERQIHAGTAHPGRFTAVHDRFLGLDEIFWAEAAGESPSTEQASRNFHGDVGIRKLHACE